MENAERDRILLNKSQEVRGKLEEWVNGKGIPLYPGEVVVFELRIEQRGTVAQDLAKPLVPTGGSTRLTREITTDLSPEHWDDIYSLPWRPLHLKVLQFMYDQKNEGATKWEIAKLIEKSSFNPSAINALFSRYGKPYRLRTWRRSYSQKLMIFIMGENEGTV